MRPPPPPLSCSIREPKQAKATDPHLHVNKKNVSNQQVDYWSEMTTGINQDWHMGLQLPTETYETSRRSLHKPQAHTYLSQGRPMHGRNILNLLTQSCALTSTIHPYQYSGDKGTVRLVPQTPEMRCIT